MSFIETPRFPEDISFGMQSGPTYNTDIVVVSSGAESRNANWTAARWKGDVSYGVRTQTQLDTLIAYFRAMKGRAHGFRIKDWSDYLVTTANGLLGAGVGTGNPTYQLNRVYTTGSLSESRVIKKPVTSTIKIFKAAVEQTLTTHYTLDSTTGIVTFVATSSKSITGITQANPGVVTATAHGFTNGQDVYISGVGGMTQVNNLTFTVAGATANTFQLSGVDTTSYTAYTSGGTAALYPQSGDALTWSGEFDIPVRFDTDEMRYSIVSKHADDLVMSWQGVPVIETREIT